MKDSAVEYFVHKVCKFLNLYTCAAWIRTKRDRQTYGGWSILWSITYPVQWFSNSVSTFLGHFVAMCPTSRFRIICLTQNRMLSISIYWNSIIYHSYYLIYELFSESFLWPELVVVIYTDQPNTFLLCLHIMKHYETHQVQA